MTCQCGRELFKSYPCLDCKIEQKTYWVIWSKELSREKLRRINKWSTSTLECYIAYHKEYIESLRNKTQAKVDNFLKISFVEPKNYKIDDHQNCSIIVATIHTITTP
jgi:hypothetical protein